MWQPIETAPKGGEKILLYWPRYAYNIDEEAEPVTDIGFWKHNYRLCSFTDEARFYRKHNASAIEAELLERGMSESYFADTAEQDDYGLALTCNAPTHWMPLPATPHASGLQAPGEN